MEGYTDPVIARALAAEQTGFRLGRRRRESFWDWVDIRPEDGCWLWRGTLNGHGYGQFIVKGRYFLAHRFAYEMEYGEVPAGKLLRHSDRCVARACVRPTHLTPGTHADNAADLQRVKASGGWMSGRTWRETEMKRRRQDALLKARMAGFEDLPVVPRRAKRRLRREIGGLLRWLLSTKLSTYPQELSRNDERQSPAA